MNPINRSFSVWSIAAIGLAFVGCGQAPDPQFGLNQVLVVSNEVSSSYQQEIANVLAAMFGTPDEPFAMPESGLDQQKLTLAAGATWSDQGGVEHGLYRKHCVHCHGISGDGRGPTARFLNPYPRDYRQGTFKFKSTRLNAKPTEADLQRLMHNGVPGTAMPSFALLPPNEVDALIEYVKYLAIRGELEQALIQYVYYELGEEEVEGEDGEVKVERTPLDPAADAEQAEVVKEMLADVLASWEEAAEQVIEPAEDQLPGDDRTPEELAASVVNGRQLFFSGKGNCFSCHGPTALGDGQQTDFDVWAKQENEFKIATQQLADTVAERETQSDLDEDEQQRLERDRKLLAEREAVVATFYPIRNAIPRNLRQGVYRGGRRPIDIFHRVSAGIAGTPMPGLGAGEGSEAKLTDEEIWNLVDFVLNLPYEPLSNPQPALPINTDEVK